MTMHPRRFVHDPSPRPKRAPPPQRAKVLAFIQAEIDADRPFPTPTAIAQHMGWKNTTNSVLYGLESDGLIRRKGPKLKIEWELTE